MTIEAVNIKQVPQVKVEAGKYYERRDGIVAKAMRSTVCHGCDLRIGDAYYDSSKGGEHKMSACDIVHEVTITTALTFELKAGEKYETQLPSGEAGPVVTLQASTMGHWNVAPFVYENSATIWLCTPDGVLHEYDNSNTLRIVRPYVEPKPPTAIERLQQWRETICRPLTPVTVVAELDAIIADLKAEASKP